MDLCWPRNLARRALALPHACCSRQYHLEALHLPAVGQPAAVVQGGARSSHAFTRATTDMLEIVLRFLTASIEEVAKSTGISRPFLGLIVLPIAGNACEHIVSIVRHVCHYVSSHVADTPQTTRNYPAVVVLKRHYHHTCISWHLQVQTSLLTCFITLWWSCADGCDCGQKG